MSYKILLLHTVRLKVHYNRKSNTITMKYILLLSIIKKQHFI